MAVLVTGGAGYIGSHIVVELQDRGYEVVVADNLCNANRKVLDRIEQITGKRPFFYEIDLRDRQALRELFDREAIDACIHLAGLKAVGESVKSPLVYYENNISGTLALLGVMRYFGVKDLIFSSSAAVYGEAVRSPIPEEAPTGQCASPYARTKCMAEQILRDLCHAETGWRVMMLRYFNPIGAHESGKLGEDPRGIPSNLMPSIAQVALGQKKELAIYGDDYDTPDGTGVRDYIHVVDLARGHVCALEKIRENCGISVYNLGTGRGHSVLEVVKNFEQAAGVRIPYVIRPHRPGDVAVCYSDVRKVEGELGWKAERNMRDMCVDFWRWKCQNPNGYA